MTRQDRRVVPWEEINERRRDKAAKAPGAPRDLSGCTGEHCSAKIRWAVTTEGKRMPVDFAPDPAGNLVRVMVAAGDWRIRVLADGEEPGPDVHRWTSHYATCPDADRFRARGRGAAGDSAPARRGELAAVANLAPLGAAAVPTPRPAPPQEALQAGTLLAVDGNSLAHRAFHAYERSGMATPDGRPVYAVYGFLRLLAGIIDRTSPDALVVGFDDRAGSIRKDRCPEYKAQRSEKSPDLYAQMDDIAAVLNELGVQVVVPDGLEADDVVGSAAAAAELAGWRCVVATSDKDAFALISGATTVLRLVSGLDNAVHMTPQALLEQYGVTPGQYPDYAALCGDTSDNLRGVTGIGPKTAARLLAAVGSVTAALDDPDAAVAAVGKAAAAKLTTGEARAALDRNWDLMAIRRDVPVDVAACRPAVDPGTVAAVLRGRHLPTLVDRVTAALCRPTPPRRLSAVPDLPAASGPAPATPGAATPGAATPTESGPAPTSAAPPLAPADPPPVCPECGRESAASLPLAQLDAARTPTLTGGEVLVDQDHPTGDLVAVLVGDVWAVRRIPAGEYHLPPGNRRRAHYCLVYPYECAAPGCGKPARLYPAGPRCDDDQPSTPRAHHGESHPTS